MKNLVQFQMAFNSVEVRSDEQAIVVKWMASTPKIDRYKSIITVDAIRNWMWNYLKNSVILLWHNADKAIWTMIEHFISNEWLEITAKLTRNTDGVFESIRDWITKGFSIWFVPLARTYKTKDWRPLQSLTNEELDKLDYSKDIVREINEIDLVEISVVNTPANPDALFTLSRAITDFFDTNEKRSFVFWMRSDAEIETTEVKTEEDNNAEEVKTDEETAEEVETKDTDNNELSQEEDKDADDSDGVEKVGESPAEAVTADDEAHKEEDEVVENEVEERVAPSQSTEFINNVIETLEVLSVRMWKLEDENKTLKTKLENIPVTRWLKVVSWKSIDANQNQWETIADAMKQAKENAFK